MSAKFTKIFQKLSYFKGKSLSSKEMEIKCKIQEKFIKLVSFKMSNKESDLLEMMTKLKSYESEIEELQTKVNESTKLNTTNASVSSNKSKGNLNSSTVIQMSQKVLKLQEKDKANL